MAAAGSTLLVLVLCTLRVTAKFNLFISQDEVRKLLGNTSNVIVLALDR